MHPDGGILMWILAVGMLVIGMAAGYVIAAVMFMDLPGKKRKQHD